MKRFFETKSHIVMLLGGVIALGIVVASATAYAQARDPAYQAARTAGLVGEKSDGYLGFVVAPSADVKGMIEDLNIKRKEAYVLGAQREGVSVVLFGQRTACILIAKSAIGEKYMGPDGVWRTRNSEPPMRDPTCV
jgi:uncharacterized protein